jgi:pimeloyl-ACP methyl ester carboxylesterase
MPHDLLTEHAFAGLTAAPSTRPVTFDGCFGWLHMPGDGQSSDTAVVLCAGLTGDKLSAHRSFRQMAEALAADGYPALRFDYPGAGDSRDADAADPWSLWQHGIENAIERVRAWTGAERVVLIGLRIGATLAALVAERRDDVAGLVLLEPVPRGQTYVRQLSIERLVNRAGVPQAGGKLDSHELVLSSEAMARIARVELHSIQIPQGCAIAVFSQSPGRGLSNLVDAWRARGLNVTCAGLEGMEPFLRPSFMNHEGSGDATPVLSWLRRAVPAKARLAFHTLETQTASLQGDGWVETPLRFGEEGRLFGVLCRPNAAVSIDMAMVIVNSSGDPHYGHGRQAVGLARRLANEGVTSLRMDFTGIGESVGPGEDRETPTHILETDRAGDIGAALDALEALGHRRFALHGLCTGAYHALHMAVADRRVAALILLNLPMFSWQHGDPVESIGVRGPKQYLRTLGRRTTGLLLRRNRLSPLRLLFGLRVAAITWWQALVAGQGPLVPAGFAQRCMDILSRRQTRTLFLYAAQDSGLEAFARAFGEGGSRLRDAELRVLDGVDHSLSRSDMRLVATDLMVEFLKRHQ